MSLKYSLTRWDILRWHIYVLLSNRILMALFLVTSLFLVWSDLRRPELAARTVGFKIFYVIFFTLIMFCIIGSITMVMLACVVMFKKFRGSLCDHELEIKDEGLVERTDVNETLHRWSGFHKIVRTGRYLYIYVTDNNVRIVPRRYFSSEQQERAFRETLESHMRSAK